MASSHQLTTSVWNISFGQYFGEIGLMLPNAPLKVSYTAGRQRVTMLVLPSLAFMQLFGRDKALLAELRMKVHQEDTSLMTVLEHSRARNLFIQHLQHLPEGNGEHRLYFYESVTQWLQLEPAGFKAAARAIAEGIILQHVPDDAPCHVAFSSALAAQMISSLDDGRLSLYSKLLRTARLEIYHGLEDSVLQSFTHGELFSQLLRALSLGHDLSDLQRELSHFEA